VLWLSWVIIPLLSASLLFTERDAFLMQRIARKREDMLEDRKRFLLYWVVRFGPTSVAYLVLFLW